MGSYVTGNPSKYSDIDLHIILDSKVSWRERGNRIVDGFLIEYFANPITKHYQYLNEDYKQRKRVNAHMFCTGKVLFDKNGELKKIIKDSKKYLAKKYPKQSKFEIEIAKYSIWDMCDNLEEVFDSNSQDFFFVYHNNLKQLFDTYSKFLRFDFIPSSKLKRFLANKKDKKKYHISNFPDQKFVKMIISSIETKNKEKAMKKYQQITKHVLKKMGDFNIDGWKIRSSAQ